MEEWHKALQEDAVRTVWWEADAVCLIDQTKLPHTRAVVRCSTVVEVSAAIRSMVVRGAPAIGESSPGHPPFGARRGHQSTGICRSSGGIIVG
jgi:hypothetical protein